MKTQLKLKPCLDIIPKDFCLYIDLTTWPNLSKFCSLTLFGKNLKMVNEKPRKTHSQDYVNGLDKAAAVRKLKKCIKACLTWLTWLIHTSVLSLNWNLAKIFALTGPLGQVQVYGKKNSDFPPCRKMVIFVTEIVMKKMASVWRNFKNISFPYVLDLMDLLEQNFCRGSNLRVKLMYESVK